jgi:hypothetical protein
VPLLRCLLLAAVSLIGLASCGDDDEPTTAAGTGADAEDTASGEGSDDGSEGDDQIDLSEVDWCALLDEGDVQAITGSTEPFVTDDGRSGACFWGVPRSGFPEYLEVSGGRSDGLDDFSYKVNDVDCPASPVEGVGEAALGGTCGTPQNKVYVVAYQDGAQVMVLVNEPKKPITPSDLVSTAEAILADL